MKSMVRYIIQWRNFLSMESFLVDGLCGSGRSQDTLCVGPAPGAGAILAGILNAQLWL